MENAFKIIRQSLARAKFDDNDTRGLTLDLIDVLERELEDASFFELDSQRVDDASRELRSHIIELLKEDELEDNKVASDEDEIRVQAKSAGEISTDEDE